MDPPLPSTPAPQEIGWMNVSVKLTQLGRSL